MATKMMLVPEIHTPHPVRIYPHSFNQTIQEKKLYSLDDQMKNILNKTNIDENEKVMMYNELLSRYLNYNQQSSHVQQHAQQEQQQQQQAPVEDHSQHVSSSLQQQYPEIKDSIVLLNKMKSYNEEKPPIQKKNKTYHYNLTFIQKQKAENILAWIRKFPSHIEWDDKGKVVFNKFKSSSSANANANINDLIYHAVSNKKQSTPPGYTPFRKILKSTNLPDSYTPRVASTIKTRSRRAVKSLKKWESFK